MTVVHDLVADIDRCAVPFQRPLDDVDRADHSGAEAARLRKHYAHDKPPLLGISTVAGIRILFGIVHYRSLSNCSIDIGIQ
jgi:hypothetical protein